MLRIEAREDGTCHAECHDMTLDEVVIVLKAVVRDIHAGVKAQDPEAARAFKSDIRSAFRSWADTWKGPGKNSIGVTAVKRQD